MSELFKDIPEFVETEIGESVIARTDTLASFRELGPPDLCHVIKSAGTKTAHKDIGSYHYCSGVEASSSASLAAYVNSLQFHVEETPAWFGKSNGWRVRTGTYCCYNAFSRVDVRVEAKIPGGVDAYVVDVRGDRHEATPAIWLETYLSAILRAILYSDDASYRLAGYRKLDPITTGDAETRFLKAVEELFFKGWQLGSDPEVQVATAVSNHLVTAISKYFGDSFRLERAVNLFERMHAQDTDVASLLAKTYIGMNEEIKAVRIMHEAIARSSLAYSVLLVQADFLLSKGKPEWAAQVAQQAINAAPSEFLTWGKLAEAQIELGDFGQALLTLNSCPMFTFNERDLHRMPTPARTHLPVKKFIADANILDDENSRDHEADVALLRLPAPGLRGTFSKAYTILTSLVSKIGWDELLKTRSAVFVMEEEYRQHKSTGSTDMSASAIIAATRKANGHAPPVADVAPTTPATPASVIPTIRISSESERVERSKSVSEVSDSNDASGTDDGDGSAVTEGKRELDVEASNAEVGAEASGAEAGEKAEVDGEAVTKDENGDTQTVVLEEPVLEKPEQLAHAPESDAVKEPEDERSAFSNKRLCERWLDNLFLVLYEDLRVYTIWRAEISHFKTQHMSYRKTGTEWEILGELALRLHHKEEAKDAFQRCVDAKFSARALLRLVESFAADGDLPRTLSAAVKLTTYHHRWYMDASYPSAIASALYRLGLTHGHAKIQYTLLSMNLPVGIFEIMQGYMKYGQTFNVEGSEF